MKIVQTPTIKRKQKQETTLEIQNQNTEGKELDILQLIEEIMKKDKSLKEETVHKYYQHK